LPRVCGIAGSITPGGRRFSADVARSVGEALRRRGPDDSGFLGWSRGASPRRSREPEACADAEVALIHRRLSVLDVSAAGWQPFASDDGRHFLVFNGEIYNYLELRGELEKEGFAFRSRCDTEVLLAALRVWGRDALFRLVGMFAFAWLDLDLRRLLLARDPFGIKPLFYASDAERFVFASEIPALLRFGGLRPRANPQRLYDYLRFGITDHGGDSLLVGIHQLAAGHFLDLSVDVLQSPVAVRYFDFEPAATQKISFDEAAARLRDLFLDSVRLHMRSDVPLGAALSGGIDSSAIVACMRKLEGPRLQLHTFSFVPDDPALSEERWVDMLGEATASHIHKVRPTAEELITDLDDLIDAQGEPFGSTSIYAQYRVFRLAAEAGIRVMLDGQGADELLAGYDPFLAARLASLLRRGSPARALRLLYTVRKRRRLSLPPLLTRAFGLLLPEVLQGPARRLVGQDLAPPWMEERWFLDRGVIPASLGGRKGRDLLRARLLDGLLETSLPMLLRYEDRNSMHFSIESRVPFLTPELARFVLSLPEEFIIDEGGTSKAVFRHAMRGIVPAAILARQDKIGFATPERRWLGALRPWIESVLRSDATREIPALRSPALHAEWEGILAGRLPFDFRVWRWLNLIRWSQRFHVSFQDS